MRWRARPGWRLALPDRAPAPIRLRLADGLATEPSWQGANRFAFLNIAHEFPREIAWNEPAHGRLWTYRLNCFEFLNQPDMTPEAGAGLLRAFASARDSLRDGLEPYPTSLRLVNWALFNARFARMPDADEQRFFFAQADLLSRSLERHLLGNHYLENGFGLLFAAAAFGNERWLRLARNILADELHEQILGDGAHFERSPMYHAILLCRALDALNLALSNPDWPGAALAGLLADKAEIMLRWLQAVTFGNGAIPLANDAAVGVAPATDALAAYANRLLATIPPERRPAPEPRAAAARAGDESGYRMIRGNGFELFCDVGPVGPDYIPGHAHADTLSFVLHAGGRPLVTDPGVSTYVKNARRQQERGTAFHNTVAVDGRDSSEVWGGFRVGRRARPTHVRETPTTLAAAHDGYGPEGHARRWDWSQPNRIAIEDRVRHAGTARFHFHPLATVRQTGEYRFETEQATITFDGARHAELEDYACPDGFNRLRPAQCIAAEFEGKLNTAISLVRT